MKAIHTKLLQYFYMMIVVVSIGGICFSNIKLDADLFSLLFRSHSQMEHMEAISKRAASGINVIFEGSTFQESMDIADKFFDKLDRKYYETIIFKITKNDFENVIEKLSEHLPYLLSVDDRNMLEKGNFDVFTEKAINSIYQPIAPSILSIAQDPFMMFSSFLKNLQTGVGMFNVSNEVFYRKYLDKHLILMRLDLNDKTISSMESLQSAVKNLNDVKESIAGENLVHISGVPIHTAESSGNCVNEINLLSFLSLLFIVILAFISFRNIAFLIPFFLSISFAFITSFYFCYLIFDNFHLLTFLFGTTLIGLSVDYSLHFLISAGVHGANNAMASIRKSLRSSLITSIINFAVLLFSSINLLQQMACFSIFGLIMSYVSIELFYPIIFSGRKIFVNLNAFDKVFTLFDVINSRIHQRKNIVPLSCVLLLPLLLFCVNSGKVQDDIRSFYTPSEKLIAEEKLFLDAMGEGLETSFLIVSGDNIEEILQKEENLTNTLNECKDKNLLESYVAISSFLPSKKRQMENYKLMQKLYNSQSQRLSDTLNIPKKFELSRPDNFLSMCTLKDVSLLSQINKLMYNTKNQKFFSTILLRKSKLDGEFFGDHSGVSVLSIPTEITKEIKAYRVQITGLSLVALLVLLVTLSMIYNRRNALKVLTPSLMSIAITVIALYVAGIPLNLFHIIAMFMVVGLGIDYSIFRLQSGSKHTKIAILLSCLTSVFSLGILSLTTFQITKSLGIVLCAGILLSFIFTNIIIRNERMA